MKYENLDLQDPADLEYALSIAISQAARTAAMPIEPATPGIELIQEVRAHAVRTLRAHLRRARVLLARGPERPRSPSRRTTTIRKAVRASTVALSVGPPPPKAPSLNGTTSSSLSVLETSNDPEYVDLSLDKQDALALPPDHPARDAILGEADKITEAEFEVLAPRWLSLLRRKR